MVDVAWCTFNGGYVYAGSCNFEVVQMFGSSVSGMTRYFLPSHPVQVRPATDKETRTQPRVNIDNTNK